MIMLDPGSPISAVETGTNISYIYHRAIPWILHWHNHWHRRFGQFPITHELALHKFFAGLYSNPLVINFALYDMILTSDIGNSRGSRRIPGACHDPVHIQRCHLFLVTSSTFSDHWQDPKRNKRCRIHWFWSQIQYDKAWSAISDRRHMSGIGLPLHQRISLQLTLKLN